MGQWVITVAGIAILSVLCDIILPEGQTRKYVKTVFGVVVTFVIVQPLLSLAGGDLHFDFQADPQLQQSYLQSVSDRANIAAEKNLEKTLSANGIDVESVSVADNSVTVKARETPSAETEAKICALVKMCYCDVAVITIWV